LRTSFKDIVFILFSYYNAAILAAVDAKDAKLSKPPIDSALNHFIFYSPRQFATI